mmetsp:Transcript_55207/g.159884  ORF Transcript_55207/g.159884 Transcript_55207/m.159884 type:complete len:97 (+) Transcript_55207:317-607(+)
MRRRLICSAYKIFFRCEWHVKSRKITIFPPQSDPIRFDGDLWMDGWFHRYLQVCLETIQKAILSLFLQNNDSRRGSYLLVDLSIQYVIDFEQDHFH